MAQAFDWGMAESWDTGMLFSDAPSQFIRVSGALLREPDSVVRKLGLTFPTLIYLEAADFKPMPLLLRWMERLFQSVEERRLVIPSLFVHASDEMTAEMANLLRDAGAYLTTYSMQELLDRLEAQARRHEDRDISATVDEGIRTGPPLTREELLAALAAAEELAD